MTSRVIRAAIAAALLAMALAGPAAAHEHREVGEYSITVGFIDEPVYTGQKSGLEFGVAHHDSEEPVEGLEETLQAEVTFEGETRDLPVSARFGEPGWYESVFFPTAAGAYTFRIFGTIDGVDVDESFTSGPDTFSEVSDVAGGQFPVVFPATSDVVRDAEAGAGAATTALIGVVLGGAGLLAGLVALGLTMARRRA
jgi:hypothetical protein